MNVIEALNHRNRSFTQPAVNSVQQGMLFPLLREEHGLLAVKVGFKQCAICGNRYEGTTCTDCDDLFDPATTSVKARDWLIIKGVYTTEGNRWWACGTGRGAHYYAQQYCVEVLVINPEMYPDPSYRLQHGSNEHDRCPLENCERHGHRHGLKGTTLWRRAKAPDKEGNSNDNE